MILKETKTKIHEILRINNPMRGIYELLWKFKVDIAISPFRLNLAIQTLVGSFPGGILLIPPHITNY